MFATDGRHRPKSVTARLLAVLGLAVTLGATAQQPSREQEQIRRLRQQLQQLQQELSTAQQAAQSAKADADQRAGVAKAEATRAKRSASSSVARVQELEAELKSLRTEQAALQSREAELRSELERDRTALAQVRAEFSSGGMRLARREGELEALQARFRSQNAALDLCARNNQTLRASSLELLQRWQRMDWRDALAAKEAFAQTERVRVENLVQGYEEQIDRASLVVPPAAAAPATLPAAGPRP
jgi:chromosome segregation ATPase